MSKRHAPYAEANDPAGALALAQSEVERLTAHGFRLRANGFHAEAADVFIQIAQALPGAWLAHYNAGAVLLEAGRLADAIGAFERALALHPFADGFSMLAHTLALRGDMRAARASYERAVALTPGDVTASWGLFEVNQLLGDNAAALRHQSVALSARSIRTIEARVQPARTTILELCIAGTFQANIPLDFILDMEHTTVHKLYVGEHPVPVLPPYDLVFNTIAQAPNAGPALSAAADFIAGQARPSLNAPQLVPRTSRESVAALFANSEFVAVAPTSRATRATLAAERPTYPCLIRPLDSHAGNDLAKIDDAAGLDAYLIATPHADEFYLSAFIDYRSADGYFRKYRIVFVDGVAFPVHLAISPRWMIHYYNAPMAENAWMRDEEHAFMRDCETVFDGPRATALAEIARELPLDYFGIDCAIAADGRVLVFEASTAMIVHMRDPVDLYPYKAQYVPRIMDALERLFAQRIARGAAR